MALSIKQLVDIARLQDTLLMAIGDDDKSVLAILGKISSVKSYEDARKHLVRDDAVKDALPPCVRDCGSFYDLSYFLDLRFNDWKEKRDFVREQFEPLTAQLRNHGIVPSEAVVSASIGKLDSQHVRFVWYKALERRESDPEGAITTARTLLECVCKHILDETDVDYDEKADLPALYRAVAKTLALSPAQHSEKVFKQILGGCHAVVEGLGALRNRLGDAHGKGKKVARPAPRHAELAVNLAGSMASFLVATWEARKGTTLRPGSTES